MIIKKKINLKSSCFISSSFGSRSPCLKRDLEARLIETKNPSKTCFKGSFYFTITNPPFKIFSLRCTILSYSGLLPKFIAQL